MHALRLAIEIPRRSIKLLALPLVQMYPDGVPIRPLDLRVHIHQRLRVIIARRYILQRLDRIAESIGRDGSRLAGFPLRNILAENQSGRAPTARLEPRLRRFSLREHHEHTSCNRRCVRGCGERHLELRSSGLLLCRNRRG